MPIVSKVMQYGLTWEVEAQRLRESGLSILAIANKMGIHDTTIKNILDGKRHRYAVNPDSISKWRQEWLNLLAKVPNRSLYLARKINYGLYLRLWRKDRSWLLSEPRRWNPRPSSTRRVDWELRDEEWSVRLRTGAVDIKNAAPLKQATRTAIILESGLPRKLLSRLDILPLCRSVFNEYSEPLDDYRERRQRVACDNKA